MMIERRGCDDDYGESEQREPRRPAAEAESHGAGRTDMITFA